MSFPNVPPSTTRFYVECCSSVPCPAASLNAQDMSALDEPQVSPINICINVASTTSIRASRRSSRAHFQFTPGLCQSTCALVQYTELPSLQQPFGAFQYPKIPGQRAAWRWIRCSSACSFCEDSAKQV